MDLYRLAKQGLTEEDCRFIIDGDDPDELAQLHEILARRRAEVSIPTGQLVGVTTEGENHVSPWKVVRRTAPPSGAIVDVVTGGSFPTLCLTEEAWEQGHRAGRGGERLDVAVSPREGLVLRPLAPDDPEVGPEV